MSNVIELKANQSGNEKKMTDDEIMTLAEECYVTGATGDLLNFGRTLLADTEKDAARYRAIRQRHAVKLSGMIDGDSNFSSDKSRLKIDAWADAAAKEVAEWDAMSPEEHRAYFEAERERLIGR